jgi:2-oxoglutarate ferredoxin oxidoreductase subunit beta
MEIEVEYEKREIAWCPGCGNFGVLSALKKAVEELNIDPHNLLMVSGIGQAGKLPHYMVGNVFNSLHGRALPVAVGAKIANNELTVIAVGGDGDGYAEGGNHFVHSAKRNHDITYLVHNNQIYSLTKGQASPTSDFGFVTKMSPHGATMPVNPVLMAIAAGATFVARGFAGDVDHLSELVKKGIRHRGFSLIDILQPCVTFNHRNTFGWYRERIYKLDEDKSYDPANRITAMERAIEWGDRIPIGVLYSHDVPSFEEQLAVISRRPLVKHKMDQGIVSGILDEFI